MGPSRTSNISLCCKYRNKAPSASLSAVRHMQEQYIGAAFVLDRFCRSKTGCVVCCLRFAHAFSWGRSPCTVFLIAPQCMQVRFFFFKSFSEIFAQLRALLEGTTECRISEISDGALESQAGEDPPANKDADEEDNRGTCLDPRLTELPDEDAESAILWTANFPIPH